MPLRHGGRYTPAEIADLRGDAILTVCGHCPHCEHALYLQCLHACAPTNARTGQPVPEMCSECDQPLLPGQALNGVLRIHWACYIKTAGYTEAKAMDAEVKKRLSNIEKSIAELRALARKL